MLGAIIGDIAGHPYEFTGRKEYPKELLPTTSCITDDSYMTIAIAATLYFCKDKLSDIEGLKKEAIFQMRNIGREYKDKAGWGENFYHWINYGYTLYDSCGNGAVMRSSPVGWIAKTEEEVKVLSKALTEVSHYHPEAIIGAEAIAMCVFLARIGKTKDEIREYISFNYYFL